MSQLKETYTVRRTAAVDDEWVAVESSHQAADEKAPVMEIELTTSPTCDQTTARRFSMAAPNFLARSKMDCSGGNPAVKWKSKGGNLDLLREGPSQQRKMLGRAASHLNEKNQSLKEETEFKKQQITSEHDEIYEDSRQQPKAIEKDLETDFSKCNVLLNELIDNVVNVEAKVQKQLQKFGEKSKEQGRAINKLEQHLEKAENANTLQMTNINARAQRFQEQLNDFTVDLRTMQGELQTITTRQASRPHPHVQNPSSSRSPRRTEQNALGDNVYIPQGQVVERESHSRDDKRQYGKSNRVQYDWELCTMPNSWISPSP